MRQEYGANLYGPPDGGILLLIHTIERRPADRLSGAERVSGVTIMDKEMPQVDIPSAPARGA